MSISIKNSRLRYLQKTLEKNHRAIGKAQDNIVILEKELGWDKMIMVDHIQGTNMAEWKCTKCNTKYISSDLLLCRKCFKIIK